MGIFEGLFRRKNQDIVNPPDTVRDTVTSQEIESDAYAMYRLISQLRDASQVREYKYAEYDVMSVDVIIKAALNMYADDATQVDENSKRMIGIECDDETLQKDLYAVLDKFKIEKRLRDTAYALGKYGNKYWKIYLNQTGSDIDHLEEIDDPATVLDLWYQGEPTYFAENPDDTHLYKNQDELDLYDHDSFIHFYVHSGDQSDVIEIFDHNKLDKNGDPIILKYKIVEGESLIETARVVWRIIRALEDSLLAARLAKADYVRVFNVEVGNASTTDARLVVNKVKKLFDSAVSMDIRNGTYTAVKAPRAWADPIFNSVSNGKGNISVESVGGDFEVKSIVDIDYFNNLLFAALRIPKPWMGFEESINGGFSNESTLVQLDIRYGKYIKKVIDAITDGLTDFLNYWLKLHNRNNQIDKFKVVYNCPSTTEELAKVKELFERVQVVSQLVDTIANTSTGINRVKLIHELLKEFVPYQVFLDKIDPILNNAIDDADQDIELMKKSKEMQMKQMEQDPSSAMGMGDMFNQDNPMSSMDMGAGVNNNQMQSNQDSADIDAILQSIE